MSVYELFDNHDDFDEDLKTQQTPKEEAQVPLAVPPAASHSLELGGGDEDDGRDSDDGCDGHENDGESECWVESFVKPKISLQI